LGYVILLLGDFIFWKTDNKELVKGNWEQKTVNNRLKNRTVTGNTGVRSFKGKGLKPEYRIW